MKTKSEEIAMLQQFTRTAGDSGADYLHEALIELAQPFELRDDIATLQQEVRDLLGARDNLRRQIERNEARERSSRERLDDLRTEARRIADSI